MNTLFFRKQNVLSDRNIGLKEKKLKQLECNQIHIKHEVSLKDLDEKSYDNHFPYVLILTKNRIYILFSMLIPKQILPLIYILFSMLIPHQPIFLRHFNSFFSPPDKTTLEKRGVHLTGPRFSQLQLEIAQHTLLKDKFGELFSST